MDKNSFLVGLRSLLNYHQAAGLDRYPKNADCQAFLRFLPPAAALPGPVMEKEKLYLKPVATGQGVRPPSRSPMRLADIAEEVATCRACDLHKQRIYPVAGCGPDNIRLLLVGDWLASDAQGQLPPDRIFGVEQDLMLARMLAAIQLPVSSVFITNVIKCAVPAACQPRANHVQSCVSFLHRQISVMRPEIICLMGMVAARAVLGKSQPLSRLRGRLHAYEMNKENNIPVVVTYHPTYLLQNTEMKAATWADLQLLAGELRQK
jgi:uracil-DNA glycosylase